MPTLQTADIDLIINVGGLLTHWTGVEEGGGELVEYPSGPVGGPPSIDWDTSGKMRTLYTYTVRTRVVGADSAAQATFRARFARGQTFDAKTSPAGSGEMFITGRPGAIGRRFVCTQDPKATYTPTAQNSTDGSLVEIEIMLKEAGPTPSGGGGA